MTTQCLRCQNYGHIARFCGNVRKCGFCASGAHETQDCHWKDDKAKHSCAVCKSPEAKHTAWARECPERVKQVAKARQAYIQRPTRFRARLPSSQGSFSSSPGSVFTFTASQSTAPSSRQRSPTSGEEREPPVALASAGTKRLRLSTQERQESQEEEEEDVAMQDQAWTPVVRRRPGRPSALSVAAKRTQNIQALMNSQPTPVYE